MISLSSAMFARPVVSRLGTHSAGRTRFPSVDVLSGFSQGQGHFQRGAGYAGKKQEVKVHHDEGVASHIDPESCAVAREGLGEALTGGA